MAKQRLRSFLMFEGLIQRVPDPPAAVDAWYERHPDRDTDEEKSWEAWRCLVLMGDLPPLLPDLE